MKAEGQSTHSCQSVLNKLLNASFSATHLLRIMMTLNEGKSNIIHQPTPSHDVITTSQLGAILKISLSLIGDEGRHTPERPRFGGMTSFY
jgi:hypothetical protein